MKAYRIVASGKLGKGELVDIKRGELDQGDVTVQTLFAGVNYKDALAGLGKAPIVRRYPCIGGIEAVGVVEESDDARFSAGDTVIAHGRGLGVQHDGGFCERLRVPGDWLLSLPEGLAPRDAAVLGVAGYSAALAVDRLERLDVEPGNGPVAVTGATGGVGSFAVAMLARRGFAVTAVTSKPEAADWLKARGAKDVVAPPEASSKPLAEALWAGAVDAAGGAQLQWLLQTARQNAAIASIGNAAGVALSTTVLPFILRGVTLTGINADSEMPLRRRIWSRLADDLKPEGLGEAGNDISLDELPAYMEEMLAGRIKGRAVVAFA
jgi:putative YhdH/YhfP family quinone oxidoreductase